MVRSNEMEFMPAFSRRNVMIPNDKNIEVLNDLLRVNQDRVEGYKLAGYNARDLDLKTLFSDMADESRKNITEITREIIHRYGNSALNKTTQTGKIYRAWMDVKSKFVGSSVKSLLASCEYGEVTAMHAYRVAKSNLSNSQLIELIERQEQTLLSAHDIISNYRKVYSKAENLFSSKI